MKNPKCEDKPLITPRHHDFVQLQNTCPLCNSQLTIRVEMFIEDHSLREEASCPKCQITARVKEHKMH